MNTQFCVRVCCTGWWWSLLVLQNLEEVLHLFQTENASLSFPDSLGTRELTQLKQFQFETITTLSCYTSVQVSGSYLFSPLPTPAERLLCLCLCPSGSQKVSSPLLHMLCLWRHFVFQTQHNRLNCWSSALAGASSSQKGGCTLKPQEFWGSHLLCIAAGLVARAEDRLCLLGLLRCDKTWQLASCRSQAHFVLRDADYQGACLHVKWQNRTILEQVPW